MIVNVFYVMAKTEQAFFMINRIKDISTLHFGETIPLMMAQACIA
jgi:hypothetical protein